MAQGTMLSELSKRHNLENVLIQFWEASSKIKGGQRYRELTIKSKQFYILSDDGMGLSLYRTYSFNKTITIQEEDEDYAVQGQRVEGVISRVFRTNTTEMSPNIAYYSLPEYPHSEFALSCGIRTSFCLPLFKTMNYSGSPDGVMELVSTCDQDLEDFRRYCNYYNTLFLQETRMFLIEFPKIDILEQENLEMQHVLKVLCQAFSIPLAQYWNITYPDLGFLSVMYQQSSIKYENSTPWRNFKEACLWMRLNIGEGLVGKTYLYHKSLFCRDITEFNIINHPLAHYARNCGSTACFTIYLSSFFPQHRECVLVFFLPSQEMDSCYPLTFLNSLLATMKKHLQNYMVISGEECGQLLSVEVINSSLHSEPETFKIGQPESYVPHYGKSENEVVVFQQLAHIKQLLFEDFIEQDEHVLAIVNSKSTINFNEEYETGETSQKLPENLPEIIHLGESEEEPLTKYIELHSFTSQAKKDILEDEGNSVLIDHSAVVATFEVAIKHKEHTAATEGVGGFTLNQLIEEAPVNDIGCARSNEEVEYAAVGTASQPSSSFQTIISLPQQVVEEERIVLDTSAGKMMLQDVLKMQNNEIIVGAERDDTTIPVVHETRIEVHTSKREKKSEENISLVTLSLHFGKPLDDAAKDLGVSRSTLKRICRRHGIKRWQPGKRRIGVNLSSMFVRKLSDDEPSSRNSSCSCMSPVQDTVVSHTSKDLSKMTVKAMYSGDIIRFQLPAISGIAELKDNVIKRLHLERNSFSIKYEDDEDDWVPIICDDDVQDCIEISRQSKKAKIKMMLLPLVNGAMHYERR